MMLKTNQIIEDHLKIVGTILKKNKKKIGLKSFKKKRKIKINKEKNQKAKNDY